MRRPFTVQDVRVDKNFRALEKKIDKFKDAMVDIRKYANFATAISAIGAMEVTLLIPNQQPITDDAIVPTNISTVITKGGSLISSNSSRVIFNGYFEAGLYGVFKGSLVVEFGAGSVKKVYPEWWGIDGVADEVEINKAINAFPYVTLQQNKDYSIEGSIVPVSNLRLRGAGKGTKILTDTAEINLINIDDANNVKISDLWLYGADRLDPSGYVVWVQGTSSECVIERCWIEQAWGGVLLDSGTSKNKVIDNDFSTLGADDGSSGYGVLAARSHENLIARNHFSTVKRHAVYISTEACYNIVTKNTIDGTMYEAIAMYSNADAAQAPCLHNKIESNIIKNCQDGIMLTQRCGHSIIAGNILENITAKGISIEGNTHYAAMTDSPYHITIEGNNINGAVHAIKVINGSYVLINDNTMSDISQYGVWLTYVGAAASCYTEYCTVTNNSINGDGYAGIIHDDFSRTRHNMIRGNSIFGFTNKVSIVNVWNGDFEIPNATTQNVVGLNIAAPWGGTWRVGDIAWNTTPAAGGTPGWVCTTAGTPGTWKPMANLGA